MNHLSLSSGPRAPTKSLRVSPAIVRGFLGQDTRRSLHFQAEDSPPPNLLHQRIDTDRRLWMKFGTRPSCALNVDLR